MSSQSNEVKLIRVPGGINAESIVAALHGRGIPARSYGEIVGEIYGLTLDGLGEVTIAVPEEYLEEARSILAAGEHGDLLLGENDPVEEPDSDSPIK
jgi:Putative prokaryotic signal transducing protein